MSARKPLAHTSFPLGRNRRLKIVVWPTNAETTKAWNRFDATTESSKSGPASGFCTYKTNGESAEIHLSLNHLSFGLWAHELQHLMNYERERRAKRMTAETLPELAERLTSRFWKWFHANFEEDKKRNWQKTIRPPIVKGRNTMSYDFEKGADLNVLPKLFAALLREGAYKATSYQSEKLVINATIRLTRGKLPRKNENLDIVVKIGRPNFAERKFIKDCKRAGEPFPVKQIQLKFPPNKKH